ncbi:MAG: hypothetical protein CI952_36 [Methanohalophilus sp.]|nr:MAG: hypothetical protein CI952_36 [Methanohalophilus sp.]
MTLDIIKPVPKTEQPDISGIDLGVIIAEGVNSGDIKDLHSCVEFVNSKIDPDIGGNEVQGTFKKVVKEAKDMSSKADSMARNGATVTEMAAEITGDYFTFDDIKQMKIEVYGTVTEWKNAMTTDEV